MFPTGVNVSGRYRKWPVFSRPPMAGFGCPPRPIVVAHSPFRGTRGPLTRSVRWDGSVRRAQRHRCHVVDTGGPRRSRRRQPKTEVRTSTSQRARHLPTTNRTPTVMLPRPLPSRVQGPPTDPSSSSRLKLNSSAMLRGSGATAFESGVIKRATSSCPITASIAAFVRRNDAHVENRHGRIAKPLVPLGHDPVLALIGSARQVRKIDVDGFLSLSLASESVDTARSLLDAAGVPREVMVYDVSAMALQVHAFTHDLAADQNVGKKRCIESAHKRATGCRALLRRSL